MLGTEDTSDDAGINQRLALELAKLGITATVEGDGLTVTVEGVEVCARIDDHTPEGTMWRLELWVDVGEDDAAAAAASAEVVQSVVAMYGRRLLKGKPANPSVPTSDQCEGVALISDEKNVRTYAMWHPQWGGYVGKCVVTYCITKDDRGKQNNTCFDVKVWHDGDFPTDDDGGETQEFHYCDPEQLIRFGRRVIKAMNDGGVDIVDPVGALEAEIARLQVERERLLAWLNKIEGGDNPTGDVADLRQWAWKAGMGSDVDDG